MRQLNPDLPRDGEKPLPAGMQLKLPTRLDRLPTPDDIVAVKGVASKHESTSPANVPLSNHTPNTAAPSQPSAPAQQAGRLIVSGSPKPGKPQDAAIQQLQDKETALTDQLTDETAKLNEANYRIDKLEKRMNALAAELARKEQEAKAAEAAHQKQMQAEKRMQWTTLAGVAAGSAALIALIAFLLHRSSRTQDRLTQIDLLPSAPLPDQSDSMLWKDIHEPAPPVREATSEPIDRPQARPSAADMDVYFLSNVASEAALLAAHGQYEQAVILLKGEIDRHPTQVVNWMQLLELMHGHRDLDEFIAQAGAFRERFASEALWERVARLGRELAPRHPLFGEASAPRTAYPAANASSNSDTADELTRVLDGMDGDKESLPDIDLQLEFDGVDNPLEPSEPQAEVVHDEPVHLQFEAPQVHLAKPDESVEAPLMFELDEELAPTPREEAIEIGVPPITPSHESFGATTPIDMSGVKEGSIEHAHLLVEAGRREEGAAMLEHLMLIGNLDERLAAAEMLVKLTSPL
jgi:hypothetical protein